MQPLMETCTWGRAADGHQLRTSATTSTLATTSTPGHGDFIISTASPLDWLTTKDDTLWQGVSGTNNPCPSGYRLPTETELENERSSWGSNNIAGAFASVLKLTLGGYRNGGAGTVIYLDQGGNYWSSTVSGTDARYLYANGSSSETGSTVRSNAISLRCIKN